MKTVRHILLLASVVVALASCDHFLDVKPVGKMIPTKVTEFENLLNNPNTVDRLMMDNNRSCSYAVMGDNLRIGEIQYNYQFTATYVNLDLLAAYIFYEPVFDPNVTYYAWQSGIYQPLAIFNNVIDGIEGLGETSEYALGIVAQAKAARAWVLLNTALTYGPMYDPAGANDTPVVPMRLDGSPAVANGPLATTAELLAQVKADLDYACEHCPASVGNPARADRACAFALRAEYDMFTRDWQAMLNDTNEAWNLALANRGSADKLIYDYADFHYVASSPVTPPAGCSPEYYMTLQGPDLDFEQTTNREILLYRGLPWGEDHNKYYPSDDWKANFDTAHDYRWKLFAVTIPGASKTVAGVKHQDTPQVNYYKDDVFQSTQAVTYPLLLLMKAEAEARTGNLAAALASLNLMRHYRYSGSETDLKGGSALSADDLLNEILCERRREQPCVSFQRTLDLKRYAFDQGKPWAKMEIEHRVGDKVFRKAITDHFFQHLPIDNAIIDYNPQWGLQRDTRVYEPYNAK